MGRKEFGEQRRYFGLRWQALTTYLGAIDNSLLQEISMDSIKL